MILQYNEHPLIAKRFLVAARDLSTWGAHLAPCSNGWFGARKCGSSTVPGKERA